ncbi:MAG: AsnC family transcriptional regulator [Candidatus Helarchaeota archaeon]|nr:AsnC family transcriptional regulator [Candidatus Helarchaeota archaeon]
MKKQDSSTKGELDELDNKILEFLQDDSRMPFTNIAKKLNVPDTTVHFRVRKLRELGIIKKFSIIIPPETLGFHIIAWITLKVGGHIVEDISIKRLNELTEYLSKMKNVKFLANTSDNNICALILTRNEAELDQIITELNHNPDIGELSVSRINKIVKGEGFTSL